jgi:hypothetical protein
MEKASKSIRSIDSAMLARIRRYGRGSVFVPADFLDVGSRAAVDQALHRLVQKRTIRRIGRGIYDYPAMHPVLGALTPPADEIARALAGRDRARLQPAGAYAANLLGLSEQVPGKWVFLTDGASKTVHVGNTTIQLRHTTPRNMATANRLSGLVIQALRHLGKKHAQPERIAHLKKSLPEHERQTLIGDLNLAPAWMRPILRELSGAG